jgi:acetyl-CoA carboxylase biotin carboxyl carrier protein
MAEANGRGLPELNQSDLARLLDLVESSDITLFRLRIGDTELTVGRGGDLPTAVPVKTPLPAEPSPAKPKERLTSTAREAPLGNVVAVRAPFAGIFFRAPTPGAQPYVDVGSEVDTDTTVGLIEAMKVYLAVRAEVHGVIERIDAANETSIESHEAILWIRPLES